MLEILNNMSKNESILSLSQFLQSLIEIKHIESRM